MKLKIAITCACALLLSACGSGSGTDQVEDQAQAVEDINWLISFDDVFQETYNNGKAWRCTSVTLWENDEIRSLQTRGWYQFAFSANPEAEEITFYTSSSNGGAKYHTRRVFDYEVNYSNVDTAWGRWSLQTGIEDWPFNGDANLMRRFHEAGHVLVNVNFLDYACLPYDFNLIEVTGTPISTATFGS